MDGDVTPGFPLGKNTHSPRLIANAGPKAVASYSSQHWGAHSAFLSIQHWRAHWTLPNMVTPVFCDRVNQGSTHSGNQENLNDITQDLWELGHQEICKPSWKPSEKWHNFIHQDVYFWGAVPTHSVYWKESQFLVIDSPGGKTVSASKFLPRYTVKRNGF